MKCYYHCDVDAVAQCVDCGKGLCKDCAHKFPDSICPDCNLKRIRADKKQLIRNLVYIIIAFFIGFYATGEGSFGMRCGFGYLCAGIPCGWSVLNKTKLDILLCLPLIGWLVYVLIKFTLSLYIGMFVAPYKIYKTVKGLLKARKEKIYCKQVLEQSSLTINQKCG